jgi:DNA-binding Lrp family transcriptional regulator
LLISDIQAKILRELIADGRQNITEIAKKIGSNTKTVKNNYEKLEKTGIITGATTHINYKLFGYKAVAHILITVDPLQADQLEEYLQKMPWVYSHYSRGIKGNIDIIAILRTLDQLNEIKDLIKRKFKVLELKTGIWTDVKEMNQNLAITDNIRNPSPKTTNTKLKLEIRNKPAKVVVIDEIDQKIADILAEDGRTSMAEIGKKIGISTDLVRKKYIKLRDNGILKITIQINLKKIGYCAMCIFFTVISGENSLLIIQQISKIPEVISIMKTTGDYDLQIYAIVQNIDQLIFIQEEISKITGISKIDLELLRFSEMLTKWPSPRQYISTF